ncbi:hypothetical protein MRX96_036387 [Rhipicephalus microplus]
MDPDLDPREIAPVRLCEQLVSTRGTLRSPPPTFPWPELTTDVVRTENRNGYADAECQTEVTVCSASELQRVKAQLRSVKQQLQSCQRKLTKAEAHANRKNGVYADIHKLSDREKLIIDQCIMKANMKSAKAARYKKEWLYDCLLLKIKSTAVYTFLHENNFLPLPHPRTLYSYLKNLKAGFGFDENLFDILKDKVEKIPKRERRGVLMFDEMSVRKSLHVRESDMALLGKVDLAEHTKPTDQVKDGDHVLVFLFRPFLGGWSQTVGAFCTSGAAPGSTVAKLILQCIVLLSNAGVIVEAVTCDNSTSNRSALNSLGVSGDVTRVSTSFEHPCDSSKVIQAIIDPPHIFKCIRNNLLKAGKFLLPGDKEVQHSHFEALLDYEEQQAGLRAVPKLTKAHISPNAFQKLSVRLAVQLFSESTASAMDFYRSREECVKLRGSKATSDFARRMNSLFDCFNSKRPQDVQYNEAEHISTLKENIEWLDRWHTYNQSLPKQKQLFFLSKPTCNALRMTLHSTVTLVEKLLNCGFRYVLVGNFGQDHLEFLVGLIFLLRLSSDLVAELPRLGASRARLLCRLRDKCLDLPQLFFPMALRRLGASLPVSLVLVGEELTLMALLAAALMVDVFTVAGCVVSVDFRNPPAAVEVMRAIGSNDTPMCGRPPVR